MILFYILISMLSALMLAASVVIVFKQGKKELICKYEQEEKKH